MESSYGFLPKASGLFSILEETRCMCLWVTYNNETHAILP